MVKTRRLANYMISYKEYPIQLGTLLLFYTNSNTYFWIIMKQTNYTGIINLIDQNKPWIWILYIET